MKFGKNLTRIIEKSIPEWGPFWINYKLLKKKIKVMSSAAEGRRHAAALDKVTTPETMLRSTGEVEFFKLMDAELKKGSSFFSGIEQQFALRTRSIEDGLRYSLYLQETPGLGLGTLYSEQCRGEMWGRLMRACVNVYQELLLLEHWAIMSYCGFSKILKKHDRMTGYMTREKYMTRVVQKQPFTQYPKLLAMLSEIERLFQQICNHLPDRAQQRDYETHIEGIKQFAASASTEYASHAEELLRRAEEDVLVGSLRARADSLGDTASLFGGSGGSSAGSARTSPAASSVSSATNCACLDRPLGDPPSAGARSRQGSSPGYAPAPPPGPSRLHGLPLQALLHTAYDGGGLGPCSGLQPGGAGGTGGGASRGLLADRALPPAAPMLGETRSGARGSMARLLSDSSHPAGGPGAPPIKKRFRSELSGGAGSDK